MSYATIDDLRSQLGAPVTAWDTPEYRAKMNHPIPAGTAVDRPKFILERCAGKRVLEFGASGPLHDAIVTVAAQCVGVDRADGPRVIGFDLDDVSQSLPSFGMMPDVIICGELLEHLSNPGHFLARLRKTFTGVPLIISVPNAFTEIGRNHLRRGIEQVNRDHVAWYSPKTLSVLLDRHGYAITEFHWYGGNGPTAEGLVVVTE